jgi:hypothetical protein
MQELEWKVCAPCSTQNYKRRSSKLIEKVKRKAIPATGRGGPQGCETSRLSHPPDNQLTDGGEGVSLTRRPRPTPSKIAGTHFCYRLSRPQGHRSARGIRPIQKSNDLIGNQTRDLPACSIVINYPDIGNNEM